MIMRRRWELKDVKVGSFKTDFPFVVVDHDDDDDEDDNDDDDVEKTISVKVWEMWRREIQWSYCDGDTGSATSIVKISNREISGKYQTRNRKIL